MAGPRDDRGRDRDAAYLSCGADQHRILPLHPPSTASPLHAAVAVEDVQRPIRLILGLRVEDRGELARATRLWSKQRAGGGLPSLERRGDRGLSRLRLLLKAPSYLLGADQRRRLAQAPRAR